MTNMMDKITSAMFAADDGEPDEGPNYPAMARAALQAIRVPDDEAVTSVWPVGRMFQNRAAFTAMIDAILSEGEV